MPADHICLVACNIAGLKGTFNTPAKAVNIPASVVIRKGISAPAAQASPIKAEIPAQAKEYE